MHEQNIKAKCLWINFLRQKVDSFVCNRITTINSEQQIALVTIITPAIIVLLHTIPPFLFSIPCIIASLHFLDSYSHTQRTILVICISLFEMIRMFSSHNNLSLVLYIVREVYGISGRNCLLTHLWWCKYVMQSLNAFVYWKILIRKWIPLENQIVFYECCWYLQECFVIYFDYYIRKEFLKFS